MADLIAYQSGDWTGATTWKGVATSTGAKQASIATNSTTTTSYVYSPTFTISNGVVIEGILMYCSLNQTGAFTVSVALSDDNGVTATREVTVNGADLPASDRPSWVFFKFGTTLTGDGGTDYRVGIKSSSNNIGRFFRSATTADWARYLRTNATATIAGTDVTFICDELTGTGAKTDVEVTMNSTASTAYGECNIGAGGVLSYGTSASTNYILDLAGNLNVWGDGTLNIGTSGTRIPSTSTALLEFTNASNVQYGLEVRAGGTCNMYGATKTTTQTLLTADAASGQKVLTVADTSGWVANDVIALASTTRTASQSEKATISTVDSGTQITTVANLTNTHHGVAPYQGEVVNLTRNVKVRGTSQTLCAYVNCATTSNFTAEYAEFYWLGSATSAKRGINSQTTTGTFSMKFCSIYDYFATTPVGINTTGSSGSPIIEDCVSFLSITNHISIGATSGTPSIQRNWFVATAGSVSFLDLGGTIKDNRFGGCGVIFSESGPTIGTIEDNVQHSGGTGFSITANCIGTFDNLTTWRNSAGGFLISAGGFNITNSSSYHNGTRNVTINSSSGGPQMMRFVSCAFNGGSGASLSQTSTQINTTLGGTVGAIFDSCSFGDVQTASGFITLTSSGFTNITFRKCTIVDTVTIASQSGLLATQDFTSVIAFDKFNNTSGSHRAYKQYGRTESDQSTFNTAAPSEALLPNDASGKLPSGSKKLAVASGTTATVSVYVRKSATYNGNQPRLIVKANSIAGITTDTVLDTMTVGTESWEQLSGTTATVSDDCVLEVYVDCDGTAGTVNVDDWSVT